MAGWNGFLLLVCFWLFRIHFPLLAALKFYMENSPCPPAPPQGGAQVSNGAPPPRCRVQGRQPALDHSKGEHWPLTLASQGTESRITGVMLLCPSTGAPSQPALPGDRNLVLSSTSPELSWFQLISRPGF